MPTVLRIDGYRFFFFSNEGRAASHNHLECGGGYAKIWLDPVKLAYPTGLTVRQLSKIRILVTEYQDYFNASCGMITLAEITPKAVAVWFTEFRLFVRLEDGREVGVPINWFPRLRQASSEQRENWRLIGNGIGIHWEEIDEDISVKRLIQGGG